MPTRNETSRRRSDEEDEVRSKLRIDDEELDQCLIEQPEYFYQAAMRSTAANAEQNGLELELKEKRAELDGSIRQRLANTETKATEAAITNELDTLPVIKDLRRKCLSAKRAADEAQALKEAFIQRSYALKDLNAIQQARLFNLGVERGSTGARNALADRNRARTEEMRGERLRDQRDGGRYRPRDQGD
jgi:hypothetical protein